MKAFCKLAAAAAAALVASSALGQSASADITVSADVQQACEITTSPVQFGTYDPVAANAAGGSDLDATGAVEVTCTRGATSVTIELADGSNHNGTTRRMANGGATEFLEYQLYQPSATTPGAGCAHTTVWGTVADTAHLTPTGTTWGATSPQSFNVCGRVPAGQDAAATTFTDTVTATVNF